MKSEGEGEGEGEGDGSNRAYQDRVAHGSTTTCTYTGMHASCIPTDQDQAHGSVDRQLHDVPPSSRAQKA